MTEPACYRIPLERYPGMNPFVLDWMKGDTRFLTRKESSAKKRAPSVSEDFVKGLIYANHVHGNEVEDEVRRWAAGGTFTIVAGQQAGFAGGPLYTIAKLASMLKIKRDNEAKGIPTTVFFWVATEDHDFDEVATIALPRKAAGSHSDLTVLRARRTIESKKAVGLVPIPEELTRDLQEVLKIPRPRWLHQGIEFGHSFEMLLATAVDEKFIIVDSIFSLLRLEGAPLIESIVERWDDIQEVITDRSDDLKAAGYAPPVSPRPNEPYTLLFQVDPGNDYRRTIWQPGEPAPPVEFTSMSALTRPLLQNYVLRPDVFMGGPAEVAYFAQIAPLHDLLNVPMPRVALRGHTLCGSARVVSYFERYGIAPEEVFTSPEKLLAAHEPESVGEIRVIAARAEEQLGAEIEKIKQLALPADHAVARSINRSIGHLNYHFRKLAERSIRGLVRKDRDRYTATRELISTFYPDHHVQDRIVAWLPFWLEYGNAFIERMIDQTEPDSPVFKIVSL